MPVLKTRPGFCDPSHSKTISIPYLPFTRSLHSSILKIARDYDLAVPLKRLKKSLTTLEEKYGSRSRNAASQIYDFKSVTHAFRLVWEAQELLSTGSLTFPSPKREELKEIKEGKYYGNLDEDIEKELDKLREIRDNSIIRDKPDLKKINKLCQKMILECRIGKGKQLDN